MTRASDRYRRSCRLRCVAALAIAATVVASAAGSPSTPVHPSVAGAAVPPTLRELAAGAGIRIGSAVTAPPTLHEPAYASALETTFGAGTPENHMKWGPIHPAPDVYDFVAADAIVAALEGDGSVVRGHTLAWHMQNPTWLTDGTWSAAEATELLEDHISTVVGRYAGRIEQWDVANEAIGIDGSPWPNPWTTSIGHPEYLDIAFTAARAADPSAELYYNDFLIELPGPRFDAVLELVDGLIARGVPIDGVGSQAHLHLGTCATARQCANGVLANALALDERGLDLAITELDVSIELPASTGELAQQAEVYRGVLQGCLLAPNCDTMVLWGVDDGHSWIPGFLPGYGAALILDAEYAPKPAHDALVEELTTPPIPPTCDDFSDAAAAQVALDIGVLGAPLLDPTADGWACINVSFRDVPPTSPFFVDVEWGVSGGLTNGYADGTFRPTTQVSRQALAAMLWRLAGSPAGPFPDPGFSDVGPDHPFRTAIAWAAQNDLVRGYADGTLRPSIAVSRQAAMAILHRTADLLEPSPS